MVMGGDSCSEGLRFDSQLDGHFSHIFEVKVVIIV